MLAGALDDVGRHEEADAIRDKTRQLLTAHADKPWCSAELAHACNQRAWGLVVNADISDREIEWALVNAKKAVEIVPTSQAFWNTLGVAHFRGRDWDACERALRKSMDLNHGGYSWDWFFMAMIEHERGHTDRARAWFDAATLWMAKFDPQHGELLRFRAEAIKLLELENQPLPTEVDVAAIGEALSAADPDLDCCWVIEGRAEIHLRRFEWREARDDLARAAAMQRDDEELQYHLAALLARAGDEPAYRVHYRHLLERYAETTDPVWAERISKACLLLPVDGDDLEAACRLAEKAVTLDATHWVMPFAQVSAALGAYRSSDWQGAIEWCDRALEKESEGIWFRNTAAFFIRASALKRLDRTESAAADYAKAAGLLDTARAAALSRPAVDPCWHEFAICELLQQEAQQILKDSAIPDH